MYYQSDSIQATMPLSTHHHTPLTKHQDLGYNPESVSAKLIKANDHESWNKNVQQSSWGEIELDAVGQYTDYLSECSSSEKGIVTDRFIPSRRSLSYSSEIPQSKQKSQNENTPPPSDPSSLSLAQIYRKCIMTEPKKSIKIDTPISHFQNNNSLKYHNNQPQNEILQSGNQQTHEEFDFTNQLVASIKMRRKLNKMPFKVLDAPALQDDFYLNLIDWGNQNFLAVGLASNVYLWNGDNSKVTKLCDLGLSDSVTSVGWAVKGNHFTVGTNNGEVHLWDVAKLRKVRVLHGHTNRVGSIAWNSTLLSTGSRDKTILHRDVRCSSAFVQKSQGHKQEICGLRWSPDEQQLCSGGNDNKVMIWNSRNGNNPILKFSDHIAAVKAVAWSPHQHGLLASGGGTADKHIRFRNTLTGETINSVDTGSQVCNLTFGKNLNQLVSTHGYSYNQINIWKYPKMQKVGTLMGHTMRVLYLCMSPDGSTVVTGAGDQTLRFWSVFPSNKDRRGGDSLLSMKTMHLR